MTTETTQVHRIWIKASPERIWEAIVDPEWNARYGYGAPGHYELTPGGKYRSEPNAGMIEYHRANGLPPLPDAIIEGEVLEVDPPRLLKQTWRLMMDPDAAAEPFSTVTFEIAEVALQPGTCKLTVTHELAGAPRSADIVGGRLEEAAGGGWAWILSDLKSLVETGKAFNE